MRQDTPGDAGPLRLTVPETLACWDETAAPVLNAYPAGAITMWTWCPFCQLPHFHGRWTGWRRAHCLDPYSPLRATGYYLMEMPLPYDATGITA